MRKFSSAVQSKKAAGSEKFKSAGTYGVRDKATVLREVGLPHMRAVPLDAALPVVCPPQFLPPPPVT